MRKHPRSILFRVYRALKFYHGPGNQSRHKALSIAYAILAWNTFGLGIYLAAKGSIGTPEETIQKCKDKGVFYSIGARGDRGPRATQEELEELTALPGEALE